MSFVSYFMAFFAMLGAIDLILKNKFGLAKEFEKGFMLFGTMALSMIGMIVISPLIGRILEPVFGIIYRYLHIDPSLIVSVLFANDMGGAPLSAEVAKNELLGNFNGLVVASMMGATFSFTIPVALGMVKKEYHKSMLLGLLCGIVTIPVGCFVSGIICKINLMVLLFNLLPVLIFSIIIAVGLIYAPGLSVKILGMFGEFIRILIVIGLAIGLLKFLTGIEIIEGLTTFEEGAGICLNAAAVMSGAFPFLKIVEKIISKPLKVIGEKAEINGASAMGFISTIATNVTTLSSMNDMDDKGIVLNAAFAVSGAFVFAGHLAFTLSFNADYILPVIVGKLVSGIAALCLASIIHRRLA